MSGDANLGFLIGLAFTLALLFMRQMYLKRQHRNQEAAS